MSEESENVLGSGTAEDLSKPCPSGESGSVVSDSSTVVRSGGPAAWKKFSAVRAECATLKMHLSRTMAAARTHAQQEHKLRKKMEVLLEENTRLAKENEMLREERGKGEGDEKVSDEDFVRIGSKTLPSVAADDNKSEPAPAIMHKLKDFHTEIDACNPLDTSDVSEAVSKVCERALQRLRQSEAERARLATELSNTEHHRDKYREQVEQLSVELNEPRRQHKLRSSISRFKPLAVERDSIADLRRENVDMKDSLEAMRGELEEWKAMVEHLGVELNKAKREKEDIVSTPPLKESEAIKKHERTTKAAPTMNADRTSNANDRTSNANENSEDIMQLIRYVNMYAERMEAGDNEEVKTQPKLNTLTLVQPVNEELSIMYKREKLLEQDSFRSWRPQRQPLGGEDGLSPSFPSEVFSKVPIQMEFPERNTKQTPVTLNEMQQKPTETKQIIKPVKNVNQASAA